MKTSFYFLLAGMTALPFRLPAQTNSTAATTGGEPPVTLIASASSLSNAPVITTTNSSAPTNSPDGTNAIVREIDIKSARGVFKPGKAVYVGNVRVIYPDMKMTCELLTAISTEAGKNTPDYIVAETNVVIDAIDNNGKPVHATANMAIFEKKVTGTTTNETIELRGNAQIVSSVGPTTGDPIIWDRVNNTLHADNPHMIINQTETRPVAPTVQKPRTNAPPLVPEKKNPERK